LLGLGNRVRGRPPGPPKLKLPTLWEKKVGRVWKRGENQKGREIWWVVGGGGDWKKEVGGTGLGKAGEKINRKVLVYVLGRKEGLRAKKNFTINAMNTPNERGDPFSRKEKKWSKSGISAQGNSHHEKTDVRKHFQLREKKEVERGGGPKKVQKILQWSISTNTL